MAELLEAWLIDRRFSVVSSDRILEEVERALEKPYFAERLSRTDRLEYIALLRREAMLITARTDVVGTVRDPNDDHVLATAVAGDARYVVSGDRDLLAVGAFQGVDLVAARDLIELLEAELRSAP